MLKGEERGQKSAKNGNVIKKGPKNYQGCCVVLVSWNIDLIGINLKKNEKSKKNIMTWSQSYKRNVVLNLFKN